MLVWNSFTASDSSLGSVAIPPFQLVQETNKSVNLQITFAPQPTYKGHFTFSITATDLGLSTYKCIKKFIPIFIKCLGLLSSTVQVKMYMIKDSNVVEFRFSNPRVDVQNKQAEVSVLCCLLYVMYLFFNFDFLLHYY